MKKKTGEWFISKITERLKFENKLTTDSNIVNLISSLSTSELGCLVDLGGVSKWENEYINSRKVEDL